MEGTMPVTCGSVCANLFRWNAGSRTFSVKVNGVNLMKEVFVEALLCHCNGPKDRQYDFSCDEQQLRERVRQVLVTLHKALDESIRDFFLWNGQFIARNPPDFSKDKKDWGKLLKDRETLRLPLIAENSIGATRLSDHPEKWVIMTRKSLVEDYIAKGVKVTPDDVWVVSLWRGYFDKPDMVFLRDWFSEAGCVPKHMHTSGHGSYTDLQRFALNLSPRYLVPIHSSGWDTHASEFPAVKRLMDGEEWSIPAPNAK